MSVGACNVQHTVTSLLYSRWLEQVLTMHTPQTSEPIENLDTSDATAIGECVGGRSA